MAGRPAKRCPYIYPARKPCIVNVAVGFQCACGGNTIIISFASLLSADFGIHNTTSGIINNINVTSSTVSGDHGNTYHHQVGRLMPARRATSPPPLPFSHSLSTESRAGKAAGKAKRRTNPEALLPLVEAGAHQRVYFPHREKFTTTTPPHHTHSENAPARLNMRERQRPPNHHTFTFIGAEQRQVRLRHSACSKAGNVSSIQG